MPLPGSRVIPPGWNTHHRPVSTASLNGACTITRRGAPGALDPSTFQHTAGDPQVIWSGPCRVQALATTEARTNFAELTLTTRRYLVVVEWQALPLVDDVVTVTSAADPLLVGQTLRVLDVTAGTEQWERDLTCEDWEG